jgi:hypothetical protein
MGGLITFLNKCKVAKQNMGTMVEDQISILGLKLSIPSVMTLAFGF